MKSKMKDEKDEHGKGRVSPVKKRPRLRPLPKIWQGAPVLRGKGMNGEAFDALLHERACDTFRPTSEQWLVIQDRALEDPDGSTQVHVFFDREDAIRCAQALSNGNIDHRVIQLGEQTLVVATMNNL